MWPALIFHSSRWYVSKAYPNIFSLNEHYFLRLKYSWKLPLTPLIFYSHTLESGTINVASKSYCSKIKLSWWEYNYCSRIEDCLQDNIATSRQTINYVTVDRRGNQSSKMFHIHCHTKRATIILVFCSKDRIKVSKILQIYFMNRERQYNIMKKYLFFCFNKQFIQFFIYF